MKNINVLPSICYGGDYNPEQWPEEVWYEDAQLMQKAGVNLVSVGIFSWAKIEPQAGIFDFEWLDKVINILYDHGVHVNLSTATASTPAWFVRIYPDSLPVDENGTRLSFGSRQHYCPNHPHLIKHIKKLVRAIAEHYKDHPALKMWHVNNEYACHVSRCYCENCAQAFRKWLKKRYHTIDELNERWGTNFWGQRYNDWDEINPPRKTPTFVNPSQELDYYRFMNDSIFNLFLAEKEILRELTPDIPISTNFMASFKPLNYFQWAEEVDIVTWDSYPDPREGLPVNHAMMNDLMRSLRQGQPFLLMEQVTSHVNWRDINVPKPPGVMRLWSYATIGRGADGIMFFQWRQSRAGAEKFHGAMVSHSGDEHSRVYREVKELGHELSQLDGLVGARIKAEVAILFDWENWWAVELASKPHNKLSYIAIVEHYYRELYKRNIAVDFARPGDDLSKYKVVIAPLLYMIKEREDENLHRFVKNGGTLLMSFFSGIVDENDKVHLGGYPALLRDILGLCVEEFVPIAEGQSNLLQVGGETFECTTWADMIRLEGAQALAVYGEDWYAGHPAVTVHHFGQGKSVYIGTHPESRFVGQLLEKVLAEHHITPPLEVPAKVEVQRRYTENEEYLIIVNHNGHDVQLTLPKDRNYQNVLSGERLHGVKLTVKGIDVVVLKEDKN
ncbi:beta-galactosidase [Caldalkalibacillus uzonensis]|uniref:Beta-galactosidase n=1 Tax=Caldalkalibacillus uzonensis TaxID=353224 RepID=A0ABU0CRE8_9BACI|nr:beta-galactosidase [Caldalkalibacillus uzonensis]MDQ0338643.1 beta-galactosidase [Caldalkalibacillus uzonensis]